MIPNMSGMSLIATEMQGWLPAKDLDTDWLGGPEVKKRHEKAGGPPLSPLSLQIENTSNSTGTGRRTFELHVSGLWLASVAAAKSLPAVYDRP